MKVGWPARPVPVPDHVQPSEKRQLGEVPSESPPLSAPRRTLEAGIRAAVAPPSYVCTPCSAPLYLGLTSSLVRFALLGAVLSDARASSMPGRGGCATSPAVQALSNLEAQHVEDGVLAVLER